MAVFDHVSKVLVFNIIQMIRIAGQMCKLDQYLHCFMCRFVCIGMLFVNVCQGRYCCVVIYHPPAFYHSSPAESKLQSTAVKAKNKS